MNEQWKMEVENKWNWLTPMVLVAMGKTWEEVVRKTEKLFKASACQSVYT